VVKLTRRHYLPFFRKKIFRHMYNMKWFTHYTYLRACSATLWLRAPPTLWPEPGRTRKLLELNSRLPGRTECKILVVGEAALEELSEAGELEFESFTAKLSPPSDIVCTSSQRLSPELGCDGKTCLNGPKCPTS
jgi:hypothetical protein